MVCPEILICDNRVTLSPIDTSPEILQKGPIITFSPILTEELTSAVS